MANDINEFQGIEKTISPDYRAIRMTMGWNEYQLLDASSGDATPSSFENCRAICADSTGIIKIDYVSDDNGTVTEVKHMIAGQHVPCRNVSRLYQYYTGATAGTAGSYNSSGTLVTNALKLYR